MMKALFALSILARLSVPSEVNTSSITYDGTSTADKNGEEWCALIYIDSISVHNSPDPPYFIFRADVYDDRGFWTESITIRNLKLAYKRQFVISTDRFNPYGAISADYFTVDSNGYLSAKYELEIQEDENYLQLTNFDESSQEVSGIFQLRFSLTESNKSAETSPKSVKISNGTFKATIKRVWLE